MIEKVKIINEVVHGFPGIEVTQAFQPQGLEIVGKISITVDEAKLPFDVKINVQYPFRFHDTENIKFINLDLIEYDHVMKDGHVCIHTTHSPELKTKLQFDLSSLQQWVVKYYLKKEGDPHYEHIIVPYSEYNGANYYFLFTDTNHNFSKGEYGFCKYSQLPFEGEMAGRKQYTYLLQSFQVKNKQVECEWSPEYKNSFKAKHGDGLFVFIEDAPVVNKRFAIDSWDELDIMVTALFKDFMFKIKNELKGASVEAPFPLFIGYRIPNGEIHWQCALINLKDYPLNAQKLAGKWYAGIFMKKSINWAATKNCSYRYFFGRGVMDPRLAEKKILIVGIGAVGSQVATTLVRGGCTKIGLVDYDLKEPENVCRAEYPFATGITSKVFDLSRSLVSISPFVELYPSDRFTDLMKYNAGFDKNFDAMVQNELNEYDYIFDCSTDDDIAYILDSMELKAKVFNLSISNNAKELVCVTNPKLYANMNGIYELIEQDKEDLYNPMGCWSPTFKASYNDVSLLVQYAIQQINFCISVDREVRKFVIEKKNENKTELILKEF